MGDLFATVRLRTTAAKRFKKVEHATALLWKVLQIAEFTFRWLKGAELLPAVYAGAQYADGRQRCRSHREICHYAGQTLRSPLPPLAKRTGGCH